MTSVVVDVRAGGAVQLGQNLVCDGYINNCAYRVQTHIHDDHMVAFDRSKGLQNIYMSSGTRSLLVATQNADIEYRDNIIQVDYNTKYLLDDGTKLTLVPSNHMLGACQVLLEHTNGLRVGYSGDFGWPLDDVIEVDQLVVDSTYGSPSSVRNYSQADAEEQLFDIVSKRIRHGPVFIKAFRGTIERVLNVISGNIEAPIFASERLIKEISVYKKFGYSIGNINPVGSHARSTFTGKSPYVRLISKGDSLGNEPYYGQCTTINCSAYMVNGYVPYNEISENAYEVALSNHADFNETLEYIERTGAKHVVTDNTRQHGMKLAQEMRYRFKDVIVTHSTNASNYY